MEISQWWQPATLFLAVSFSLITIGYSDPVMNTKKQTYSGTIGNTAYMECKVTGLQTGQTVSWTFVDHAITISKGNSIQVTDPDKYEIVKAQTDQGGQSFWNLKVYNLKSSDGGSYTCMVDGTKVSVTHTLTISDAPPSPKQVVLNETDCCIEKGVDECALPVCDQGSPPDRLLDILATGADCVDANLMRILECGGDGRNHEGCCMRRGVTEFCQPLCYYEIKDASYLNRDYTQCIPQSILIAQCMTIGQANLPSQPEAVSAVSLPNAFLITWTAPRENAHLVTSYKVQYKLKSDKEYSTTEEVRGSPKTITNLQENAVYQARVIAVSDYGASAPSDTLDIATSSKASVAGRNDSILACCQKQQVSTQCQSYCFAETLRIGFHPDNVLPCYGELHKIFSCLVGGDITPCCNRTQVPEDCLQLCSGKMVRVDYSETPCMITLPLIAACAIEGSGFLPSPPSNTIIVPGGVTSNSAIIAWNPPSDNSANSYQVLWKPDKTVSSDYSTAEVIGTRHQLTGLTQSTLYEVMVASVNQNGTSLPELRLHFVTEGDEPPPPPFNEQDCCKDKGVPDQCLQICNHTVRLSDDATLLGFACIDSLIPMLLCGTDGRDHTYCCKEAGVSDSCLHLCNLTKVEELEVTNELLQCVLQKNKISTCADEGKEYLPKFPTEIWIEKRDISSLVMKWKTPSGPNITSYIVEYSSDDKTWMSVTTPHTFVTVSPLDPGTGYYLRVYSVADNYTSLPSQKVKGATLPVRVTNATTDWTQVWQNRSLCCENSGLEDTCKDACVSGDIQNTECFSSINKIIACGADGRDHRPCCRDFEGFPDACLPYCEGQTPPVDPRVTFCASYFPVILTCFTNGQGLIPTPPQNFRVTQFSHENITVSWDPPASNCDTADCSYYVAVWEDGYQNRMKRMRTASTSYTVTGLKSITKYWVVAVARSGQGDSLPSTAVQILTKPAPFEEIVVYQTPNSDVVDFGTSVTLQCTVSSSPYRVAIYKWIRNNKVASYNDILTVKQVSQEDEGSYTCEVTYINKISVNKTHWLNIKYLPDGVKITEDTVMPGLKMDATLVCQFKGFPDRVTWTKDGHSASDYTKYQDRLQPDYTTGITTSTLRVINVVEADYGSYKCVGRNRFGSNPQGLTGQLRNMLPTITYPTLPPNATVYDCCITEGVSEQCAKDLCTFSVDFGAASGQTQCLPYLTQLIFCGADHRDHSQCCKKQGIHEICLPICRGVVPDFAQIDDYFVCLQNIETIMQCAEDGQRFVPTHPQSVSALVKYDKIVVTWAPPLENADKVDIYEIFHSSNDSQDVPKSQVSGTSTSIAIPDVRKGVTYQIWMLAKNDYGQSHKTDHIPVNVIALTPSRPVNLELSVVNNVNIRVSWQKPFSRIIVTVYWVYFKPDFEKEYKHVEVAGTTTRLEYLRANTRYAVYVVPQSQDGLGEPSETSYVSTSTVPFYFSTPVPQKSSSEKTVGLAVGLTLALVLLIAVAVLSVFFYRRMGSRKFTSENNVAFENPHYGEQASGVKISGLPGSSESDNQFGYSTLHEETDPEPRYTGIENDTSRNDIDTRRHADASNNADNKHAYDNPLAKDTEEPATLKVDQ